MGSRANRKNRDRLYSIPGTVPNLLSPPTGCRFNPRCPYAQAICKEESPKPERVAANHWVRCHFWRDVVQAEPARRDVVEAGR
jgi:oligopeptide/dipeptide ABC transporter ATP-binding protein